MFHPSGKIDHPNPTLDLDKLGRQNLTMHSLNYQCVQHKSALSDSEDNWPEVSQGRALSDSPATSQPEWPWLLLQPKIVLSQVVRGLRTPSINPIVLELETFLRIAKIPYEIESDFGSSDDACSAAVSSGPLITINGEELLGGAETCIKELCQRLRLDFLNDYHEHEMKQDVILAKLRGKIMWGIHLWRWVFDEGRTLRKIVPASFKKTTLRRFSQYISKSGYSYFESSKQITKTRIMETVMGCLTDISSMLGDRLFINGDQPGLVDCCAFGVLAQIVWSMPGSPLEGDIKQHSNIMQLVHRMKNKYWTTDWEITLPKYDFLEMPHSNTSCSGDSLSLKMGSYTDIICSSDDEIAEIDDNEIDNAILSEEGETQWDLSENETGEELSNLKNLNQMQQSNNSRTSLHDIQLIFQDDETLQIQTVESNASIETTTVSPENMQIQGTHPTSSSCESDPEDRPSTGSRSAPGRISRIFSAVKLNVAPQLTNRKLLIRQSIAKKLLFRRPLSTQEAKEYEIYKIQTPLHINNLASQYHPPNGFTFYDHDRAYEAQFISTYSRKNVGERSASSKQRGK